MDKVVLRPMDMESTIYIWVHHPNIPALAFLLQLPWLGDAEVVEEVKTQTEVWEMISTKRSMFKM